MTSGNHNWAAPVSRYTDFHPQHGDKSVSALQQSCGAVNNQISLVDKGISSTRDAVKKTVDEVGDVNESAAARDRDLTSMVERKDRASKTDLQYLLQRYVKLVNYLKSKNRPSAEVFVRRSTLYHTLGSYQAALEDAKQAVSLSPRMPVAHFRVGITLYALGRYEDAAQAFLDGLAGEPENKYLDNARMMVLAKLQSRKRR